MIALVVGPPGSGKSYTSTSMIVEALRQGQLVATNIELTDGWALDVAKTYPLWWLKGRRWREGKALELRRRVFISADLSELFRVRIAPCGRCDGCGRGKVCRREGRGRMVLDEAHNWMNARTWDADPSGKSASKAEAVNRRLAVVRFFSQHRKLGWEVFLITQDEANIDRQVRSLFEYLIRLRNLRNFKVAGIRVFPCNLFLAIWGWNDPSKSVAKRQLRILRKRVARLYDTMALSHGLEDDAEGDPIWLPLEQPAEWPGEAEREAPADPAPPDLAPDPAGGIVAAPLPPRAAREAQPFSVARTSPDSPAGASVRPAPVAGAVRTSRDIPPSMTGVGPYNEQRPGGHPGVANDLRRTGRDRGSG